MKFSPVETADYKMNWIYNGYKVYTPLKKQVFVI